MKKTITMAALATLWLVSVSMDAAENKASNTSPASPTLAGTWEMVSVKYGDATEFTETPKDLRATKFITPTHFIWVHVDPKTKKISNSMGGTYSFRDGQYIETPEFAFEGMEAYIGKAQKFTAKIEGDKWIHSGVLSDGMKLEEIWQRVK